jgi:aminoglycoside phosphotransferase (APT) family kinase protein
LLKDLRRSELEPQALLAKPDFLHDTGREAEAYRLLAPVRLGVPHCHHAGPDWLLLEKVPGIELWQIGDLQTWAEAARWLARLHRSFAGSPPASPTLLRYDAAYFALWAPRAVERYPELAALATEHERAVDLLASLPVTFVHGEFYPSNVLVAGDRIAPVDWEMAGIGPGVLDLAALVAGWGEEERRALRSAYGDVDEIALEAARLHVAFQWLGWSSRWTPPNEHAHDWLAEARDAALHLGMSVG